MQQEREKGERKEREEAQTTTKIQEKDERVRKEREETGAARLNGRLQEEARQEAQ